jgi:hypothetical protein
MSKKATFVLATLLGLVGWLNGRTTANELRFSELDQRLRAIERQLSGQQAVQPASYLSDDGGKVVAPSGTNCQPCCDDCCRGYGAYYGEVQLMWIRPHIQEDWIGKLSEEHHFSPRIVFGYEDSCGLGARVRYWNFDDTIRVLDPSTFDLELNVVDVEATNRICFRSTDVVLGGGFRYAHWGIDDDEGDEVDLNAYGLTMAADVHTPLCVSPCTCWSFVYGGRLSLLFGDWEGENLIMTSWDVRDDNLLVTELYTGIEYLRSFDGYDLFARAVTEFQNWRSDVLASPDTGPSTDSIGFLGFGIHIGVAY